MLSQLTQSDPTPSAPQVNEWVLNKDIYLSRKLFNRALDKYVFLATQGKVCRTENSNDKNISLCL